MMALRSVPRGRGVKSLRLLGPLPHEVACTDFFSSAPCFDSIKRNQRNQKANACRGLREGPPRGASQIGYLFSVSSATLYRPRKRRREIQGGGGVVEVARREWDRLAGELGKLKLLTPLDRAALGAYCGAYALWAEATEAIQKYGTMVKSPSGYPIQSPYVSIANRQAEIMMRYASEFGFTPASRSRISMPADDAPDLFDIPDSPADETTK